MKKNKYSARLPSERHLTYQFYIENKKAKVHMLNLIFDLALKNICRLRMR